MTSMHRLWSATLCLTALGVAASCSDSGNRDFSEGKAGSSGASTGGSNGQSGAATAGSATSGSGGASAGNAANGGAGAGTAGSAAGGDVGGSAGAGGAAGGGGSGGGNAGAFEPCNTEPAAQVPMLKRGAAITGFDGMQTAGQMVGVPGEAGLLYVIGHRDGQVFTVQNGAVADAPLVTVAVADGGNNEQGLLSMALHPSFATNHLFYLFYTAENNDMTIDEFERTSATAATFKRNVYKE